MKIEKKINNFLRNGSADCFSAEELAKKVNISAKYLRHLLRKGKIKGGKQEPNKRYGRWFIYPK